MPRQAHALKNRRFGRLLVIDRYIDETRKTKKSSFWLCKCDCGNITVVRSDHLLKDETISCGCYQKEVIKRVGQKQLIDLTHKRFGRYTVLKRHGTDNNNNPMWECRCDCGAIKIVRGFNLVNGTIKSCGCFSRENASRLNRTHGLSKTPEYKRNKQAKRRAKEHGLGHNWNCTFSKLLRNFMNNRCVVCGMTNQEHIEKYYEDLHIDHVIPLSKGGKLCPGNVVLLCEGCNIRKSNKLLSELDNDTRRAILERASAFKTYLQTVPNPEWAK